MEKYICVLKRILINLKNDNSKDKQTSIKSFLAKKYYTTIDYIGIIGPIDKAISVFGAKCISTIKTQLNGFNDRILQKNINNVNAFNNRDNIIILSGRLDSPEKGLDVFFKSDNQN